MCLEECTRSKQHTNKQTMLPMNIENRDKDFRVSLFNFDSGIVKLHYMIREIT